MSRERGQAICGLLRLAASLGIVICRFTYIVACVTTSFLWMKIYTLLSIK